MATDEFNEPMQQLQIVIEVNFEYSADKVIDMGHDENFLCNDDEVETDEIEVTYKLDEDRHEVLSEIEDDQILDDDNLVQERVDTFRQWVDNEPYDDDLFTLFEERLDDDSMGIDEKYTLNEEPEKQHEM